MQTSPLPLSVCDEIDKKIRRFVWGGQEGKRKTHLVSWNTICKPKSQGGLGLRSARNLNMAYMIKLAWQMLNNDSELWVQVLQGKYFKHKDGVITSMKKSNHSNLWKAIVKAMPLMKSGCCWSIRNGESTSFWSHPWIDCDLKLEDFLLDDLTPTERNSPVAAWATEEGEWDWNRLKPLLPDDILNLIAGMEVPNAQLGEDKTIWAMERDGRFRLKSAYALAAGLDEADDDQSWTKLWKWKGPNRVKHFLWLVMHDRLMTNKERAKRKLTDNQNCSQCKDVEESIEHILQQCPSAKLTWIKFKDKLKVNRTGMDFKEWMMKNLSDEQSGIDFGIVCWNIWKQRNEHAMEGKAFNLQSLTCRIQAWFNIVKQAKLLVRKTSTAGGPSTCKKHVSWKPPREGWIQLQTDGSFYSSTGSAAAGGLLRDHLGRCSKAFVCNLGTCSITCAELKAAAVGLKIAWDEGHKKVELNIDSETAIAIIKNSVDDDHRHGLLAATINKLLSLEWEVKITHVFREMNSAADYLANVGHCYSFGTHSFDVYEVGLRRWLFHDVMGISQDRVITVMN
ncbi:unnamed protein product [Linum trigynum]|uniref:RNase H type-1 domain-containing protein n=1 Tax=Linum trigynum TaxID=586398 RepID=A0AAV2EFR7_9ROSI